MKVNVPITPEQHEEADRKYAEVVKSQKDYSYDLVKRLRAGSELTDNDREWAASIVEAWANNLPTKRKRPKGKPALLPDEIGIMYWTSRSKGQGSNALIEQYAEKYGVTTQAVRSKIDQLTESDSFTQLMKHHAEKFQ